MSRRRTKNYAEGPLIGLRLARFRKLQHLSQSELTTLVNALWKRDFPNSTPISSAWISRVEAGHSDSVDLTRLTYIARAMDLPVSELLPLEQITPVSEKALSEADIAISLRRYGLTEEGVKSVMDYVDFWRTSKPRTARLDYFPDRDGEE